VVDPVVVPNPKPKVDEQEQAPYVAPIDCSSREIERFERRKSEEEEEGGARINVPIFVFPKECQKEHLLLLDTTGSMNFGTSESDEKPRRETVRGAMELLVSECGQARGLRTITFAGDDAYDLGDVTPSNLATKWKTIRFRGGTKLIPGWQALLKIYNDQFAELKTPPLLMALVITDGEAEDSSDFARLLSENSLAYVTLALLGYGAEHDSAMKTYQAIAADNKRVRVVGFGDETDPRKIAKTLLEVVKFDEGETI